MLPMWVRIGVGLAVVLMVLLIWQGLTHFDAYLHFDPHVYEGSDFIL